MSSGNRRKDVIVGILGIGFHRTPESHSAYHCSALQGAFAEHRVALQSLSLERNIVVVLVRTVEELVECNALIIPGGGA
jgi:hypothetical protein